MTIPPSQRMTMDRIVYQTASRRGDGVLYSGITPRHLAMRFAAGQNLTDISRDLPGIPIHRLFLLRAFIAAKYPDLFPPPPDLVQPLSVLCDENIGSPRLTDKARRVFGRATSIHIENMAGRPDTDVWRFAVKNGIDLIVTKDKARIRSREDKDLTHCALDAWSGILQSTRGVVNDTIRGLPRIVHITNFELSNDDIASLLEREAPTITELFEEASSPIISLSEGGAKPGIHFNELYREGLFERMRRLRDEIVKAVIDDMIWEESVTQATRARIKRLVEHEISRQRAEHNLDSFIQAQKIRRVADSLLSLPEEVILCEAASSGEVVNTIPETMRRYPSAMASFTSVAKVRLSRHASDPLKKPLPVRLTQWKQRGRPTRPFYPAAA